MRQTSILRCFLRSRRVLARRGHGGVAQAQKELERLALLEQSMMKPAAVRAQQLPAVAQAAAAAYLREVPDRVERARAAAAGEAATGSVIAIASASSAKHTNDCALPQSAREEEPQVSNLTQFLSMCKQLKIRYSCESDAALRRSGRKALRSFWARHAASAVACCFQGVREVGFVADYGLTDTGMHLELPELWVMLHVLKAESAVASSFNATRILHYLARELQYMECGRPTTSHRRGAPPVLAGNLPSSSELLAFRQALADLALDLLAFYFVAHNPSVKIMPPLTGESGEATGKRDNGANNSSSSPLRNASIATAIDALSGLEVLSVLSAHDATPEVITKVWEVRQLCYLRLQREPAVVVATQMSPSFPPCAASAISSTALAHEVHYLLVAELFRFVAMQRRDLRLTDVVHGHSLLRVHLRTLWPPYARCNNTSGSSSSAVQVNDEGRHSTSRKDTSLDSATTARRLPLWYEKDTLFRVAWGLAIALVSKDRKLVSSYHYVKIVTTLAKLPAFVLAPTPAPRKELRRFELTSRVAAGEAQQNSDVETPGADDGLQNEHLSILSEIPPEFRAESRPLGAEYTHSASRDGDTSRSNEGKGEAVVALRPADFWRFIISKACVFVPNLPPDQRRVVCRSLHLAITEKRGHLLQNGEQKGPHSHHAVQPQRRGVPSKLGRAVTRFASVPGSVERSDDAADILLPLVEEMAAYTENYDAYVHGSRKPALRSQRRGNPKDSK
ncbi:hypothetical protein ABL78_7405 [Leptomonas seymouri]|uniref:Uncharacterized protein n=1 Tax=Leptomonas seymouri TaxID=5684 RepID=A0A0N1PA41_LEPSE|nr:hypothetical protein ABL78_7405 [Leptomonas seymouri]|eukprot:KPI83548.1 hypothetical protein ABL78_7405 [Leptomonas seymouri]